MDIKDYIKDATSKIFDTKEKKKVTLELTDHILNHKEFNEEIGYDADKAEEMAVEKMGEGTEIAEELGNLHNDFYTPVWDIVFTVIWLAILGGAYYMLKEHIFDDIAAVPITLGTICISAALYFAAGTVMLKRNKLQAVICNFVGAAGTGALIFLCISNINKLTGGSIDNLKSLIFNHILCKQTTESSKAIIMIAVISFSVSAAVSILISLIYYIKHSTANNTLFDNHFKKFAGNFTILLSLVFIVISGLFAYNYFTTKNIIKEEYYSYYSQAIDIAKSCKTFDEVYDYIDRIDENDEYTAHVDKKGVTQSITFTKNLVYLEIERQEEGSYNDLVVSNYGLVDAGSALDDTFYNDYTLYFSLNFNSFYKTNDYPCVEQLVTDESTLDKITRFDMERHTSDERIDFLAQYPPKLLVCQPNKNDKYPAFFNWTYLMGDVYKYERLFSVTTYAEKYNKIFDKQQELVDIIKANPNADFDEIARLTGTELIPYPISYEEYKGTVDILGTMFDPIKNDLLEK